MRIHGLVLAILLGTAGCPPPDTAVRLMVRLGQVPAPQQLRVTVFGSRGMLAAPTMIAHPALPGTVTIDRLNPALIELCVEVEGLAADGTVTSRGSADVGIVPDMTANAAVDLGATAMSCGTRSDGGVSDGGAGDGGLRDGGGGDGGVTVAICPAGSYFCDDFESGDTSRFDVRNIKFDAGASLDVQKLIVKHGVFALHAAAASPDMGALITAHAFVGKLFTPLPPPIAVRAYVFAKEPIDHYGVTVELYDDTFHGFAAEADNQNVWTLTEDQAQNGGMDRHTDMVPFGTGAWHCVEIVVDANGFVSFFVDNHQLLPTFLRMSAVSYTTLQVGIGRTINSVDDVYIDDVAVAPSRLYCP